MPAAWRLERIAGRGSNTKKEGVTGTFGSRTGKEVETPWARPGKPEGQLFQTLGFPHWLTCDAMKD